MKVGGGFFFLDSCRRTSRLVSLQAPQGDRGCKRGHVKLEDRGVLERSPFSSLFDLWPCRCEVAVALRSDAMLDARRGRDVAWRLFFSAFQV